MNEAKASAPTIPPRQVAANLADHVEGLRRDGSIDLGRLDRLMGSLEDLLRRAGRAGGTGAPPPIERLILLDEATKLRDALAREVCSIRRALDQERQRHRAAILYRRNGA